MAAKLILTRSQIAQFVGDDPRAIKQIESLFAAIEALNAQVDTSSSAFDASAALASVNRLAGVVAQLAQDGAIEASNALAIAQAAERALNAVSELAMVGATLPPLVPRRRNAGAWYDTTSQTLTAINTGKPVTLNSTSFERGVWRDPATTSRIYVADAGVYNLEFSAQLDKTTGGSDPVYIWIRVNGVDVPNTTTLIQMKGNNDELVAAWNFLLELAGGDYVELVWASPTLAMRLEQFAASAFAPAIPSVILTITQEA